MENKRGRVCMALGALLLIMALGLTLYNVWDDKRAASGAQEALAELRAVEPEREQKSQSLPENILPDYLVDARVEMPIVEIDGNSYIGYISIPSLELELPVLSEWSYPNLKIAPCRYYGSVYLDNMIIAAHNYNRHFGRIHSLEAGDAVCFTDMDGNEFYYSVLSIEQLWPNQAKEMADSEREWDLTLFTCTVGGRQRVTVRCVRTDTGVA